MSFLRRSSFDSILILNCWLTLFFYSSSLLLWRQFHSVILLGELKVGTCSIKRLQRYPFRCGLIVIVYPFQNFCLTSSKYCHYFSNFVKMLSQSHTWVCSLSCSLLHLGRDKVSEIGSLGCVLLGKFWNNNTWIER